MAKRNNIDYDQLIVSFLKGDKKSFYILVNEWKEQMINFFYQHLGDYELSEELSQEVFISIWKLKTYTSKGFFSTFIYRIAQNKLIDFYRKKKINTVAIEEQILPSIVSDINNIESKFLINEEKQIIRNVINSLPEEEKKILILSQLHELSHKELASVMDCSVNSIKGKIFRAVNKFVSKFKEMELNENVR
jgi:RNA polymerase sigma-70 factor (ECF subfamily)